MDIYQNVKNGKYLLSEDLIEKLPNRLILTLASDQKALRIYSEDRWESILSRVQKQCAAKTILTAATNAIIASAHITEVGRGNFQIPESLLLRTGLYLKKIRVEFEDGVGAVLSSEDERLGEGMPAELSFSGKYHVQNEDGLLIIDFEGLEPELWIEKHGSTHRLLPLTEPNGSQQCLALPATIELESLAQKYDQFFTRAFRILGSFTDGKLFLLDFFFRYGRTAVELAEDCPALAYVAAYHSRCGFRSVISDECGHLPEKKRTELLRLAGYVDQPWVAKLFRKIPALECSGVFFHDLKIVLFSEDKRKNQILKHLPLINHIVVRVLEDDDFLKGFHSSFFHSVQLLAYENGTAENFWELYNLKDALLEAKEQGFSPRLIRKSEDLAIVHDQLVHWMEDRHYLEMIEAEEFPPPPFQAYQLAEKSEYGIFPLITPKALWEEGKRMRHCIAGFVSLICERKGRFYAYHVEMPEENATFTIQKEYGYWEISEIRGIQNAEVSPKIFALVTDWLEKEAGSL